MRNVKFVSAACLASLWASSTALASAPDALIPLFASLLIVNPALLVITVISLTLQASKRPSSPWSIAGMGFALLCLTVFLVGLGFFKHIVVPSSDYYFFHSPFSWLTVALVLSAFGSFLLLCVRTYQKKLLPHK